MYIIESYRIIVMAHKVYMKLMVLSTFGTFRILYVDFIRTGVKMEWNL